MSKPGTIDRALEIADNVEQYSNFELRVAIQNIAAHYRELLRRMDIVDAEQRLRDREAM